MVPAENVGSGGLRDLRDADPEGFIMVVAAKYRLLVNAGLASDQALLRLIWEVGDEGVNLPRVLDNHPTRTQAYFGDAPEFPEQLKSDLDRYIADREPEDA